MIHARRDYMRFQDPALVDRSLLGDGSTPIAEDEPVMLFRAQDRFFVGVLTVYRWLLLAARLHDMAALVEQHISLALQWQASHATKTPDVPQEKVKR